VSLPTLPITVAIPTFGRDGVLLDTVEQFRRQGTPPAEILVVDQTPAHDEATEQALLALHREGAIRWIRLAAPSQPAALNVALRAATQPVVLMVDDDIRVGTGFVASHLGNYADPRVWAVAGQVLQPGEDPLEGYEHPSAASPLSDVGFVFRSARRQTVRNGMSGNLSVRRDAALRIGGFDESFAPPVSYRFDAEFCERLARAGGEIVFDPKASLRHLRHPRGGTRSMGDHKRSASPMHGVGDYYFAFRQGLSPSTLYYVARRPVREVCTRYHLRHPWWIPVKLVGELRALAAAFRLSRKPPRLIAHELPGHLPGRRSASPPVRSSS
jgi:GT2 family glycosyltransferase